MGSGEIFGARQTASPPKAVEANPAKGGGARRRPRYRSGTVSSPQSVTVQYSSSITQELNNELLNAACACEILQEELSERALARKFMWEFFD
jgi:hypothetical protein